MHPKNMSSREDATPIRSAIADASSAVAAEMASETEIAARVIFAHPENMPVMSTPWVLRQMSVRSALSTFPHSANMYWSPTAPVQSAVRASTMSELSS